MMSTRSTAVLQVGSPKARPLSWKGSVKRPLQCPFTAGVRSVQIRRRRRAKAMTLPSCFPDRTALTVSYGTAVCVV